MIENLKKQLAVSPTSYHAVAEAEKMLIENGFVRLEQNKPWKLKIGDKVFVAIDGSSLVAFVIGGEHYSYNIVASHTDSPCFKLKGDCVVASGDYKKLNVEGYGSPLYFTWFDRPLTIAGRVIVRDSKTKQLVSKLVTSKNRFVIPSLAIHLNREANKELKLNIRKDLLPLFGLGEENLLDGILGQNHGLDVVEHDLFLCTSSDGFEFGAGGEFFCAPRLDNQTSVFSSIEALINSTPKCVAVAYLADNEEVGSRTKQGAGATVLKDTVSRINSSLGYDDEKLKIALTDSFMTSCDNSHAVHPNNAELADDTSKNYLGKGIVIKHHANQSYTTDAFSSAIIKEIFTSAGVKFQDFFNRSDLPSGGTLGAISSSQLSIRSVDIGLPQLAMHSAAETIAAADYPLLIEGLKAFYNAAIVSSNDGIKIEK